MFPKFINNTGRDIQAGELIRGVSLNGDPSVEFEIIEDEDGLVLRPISNSDDTEVE
jgi:hypothetical protein